MRSKRSATHSPLRSLISPAMGMGIDSSTVPSLTSAMPPFCSRSFSTAYTISWSLTPVTITLWESWATESAIAPARMP